MELVARLDEYGKPAWIALTVLAFILFWPFGLVLLAYLIWSGRMGCWKGCGPGRWYETRESRRRRRDRRRKGESSGNAAFDEYREETLRRLEEEQGEFETFLERLRHAKDKAEFDQFMDERRRKGPVSDDEPGEPGDPTGGQPRYPRAPEGGAPQPAG